MKMFNIQSNSYGTVMHGWTIPAGAIYGNFYKKDYVCTDLTPFRDKIFVHRFDNGEWIETVADKGLTKMILEQAALRGITKLHCKPCDPFSTIRPELANANVKHKCTTLKNANQRYAARGNNRTLRMF